MPRRMLATPALVNQYINLFVNRRAYTVQSFRPDPEKGRHYYYRPTERGSGAARLLNEVQSRDPDVRRADLDELGDVGGAREEDLVATPVGGGDERPLGRPGHADADGPEDVERLVHQPAFVGNRDFQGHEAVEL